MEKITAREILRYSTYGILTDIVIGWVSFTDAFFVPTRKLSSPNASFQYGPIPLAMKARDLFLTARSKSMTIKNVIISSKLYHSCIMMEPASGSLISKMKCFFFSS